MEIAAGVDDIPGTNLHSLENSMQFCTIMPRTGKRMPQVSAMKAGNYMQMQPHWRAYCLRNRINLVFRHD